jgi:hypothetical protein
MAKKATARDRESCREPVRAYCHYCDNRAVVHVVVSVDEAHNGARDLCWTCHAVYLVGVQHGRFHEAARYGLLPGRDSSQYPPRLAPRGKKKKGKK